MKKRIISMILVVIMSLGLVACENKNKKEERSTDPGIAITKQISGTYSFQMGSDQPVIEYPFYYCDDYFDTASDVYDSRLASLGMCINIAMAPSYELEKKSDGLKNFLSQLGFPKERMVVELLDSPTTKDGVGSLIASKVVGDETIMLVCLRGVGYGREFLGNFVVGETGDSQGFAKPAKRVLERIKAYQKEYDIKSCKMFMTGYSRSGAITDLAAAYIDEALDEYHVEKKDFFAYTFEAPRASASAKGYTNIHNVVDKRDLVPYLVFEGWGFERNGVIHYVGDDEATCTSRYLSKTSMVEGPKVSIAKFYEEFEDLLTSCVSREEYAAEVQQALWEVLHLVFDQDAKQEEAIDGFMSELMDGMGYFTKAKFLLYAKDYVDLNKDFDYDKATSFLTDYIRDVQKKTKCGISDENVDIIIKNIKPLLRGFREPVAKDYAYEKDGVPYPLMHFGTITQMTGVIYNHHALENFVRYVYEEDDNFEDEIGKYFNLKSE